MPLACPPSALAVSETEVTETDSVPRAGAGDGEGDGEGDRVGEGVGEGGADVREGAGVAWREAVWVGAAVVAGDVVAGDVTDPCAGPAWVLAG